MSNILRGKLMPFSVFFVISLLLSATIRLYGQDKTFDERYDEVYHSVFASGPQGALAVADSLNAVAEGDEQRMKSRMLLGTIHHSLGNTSEALFQVMKAQEIATKGRHKSWEARATGFLANMYRLIGLVDEAKKGYEHAEKLNEAQKSEPSYYLTKANILQEKAYITITEENYVQALSFLQEADRAIHQDLSNTERTKLVRAINDQIQATCYLYLGEVDVADSLLRHAGVIIDNHNSMVVPYIYRSKAEAALKNQQYDSAHYYLQLIEPFVQSSQDLEKLLYSTTAKYYQSLGDHEQAMYYMVKGQAVAKAQEENATKVVGEFVQKLENYNRSHQKRLTAGWWGGIGIVILLGVGIVALYVKRRRERSIYIAIINRIESGDSLKIAEKNVIVDKEAGLVKDTKGVRISKDTETRLLALFERLEEQYFFLDKHVSLATLATALNTNPRYASYIVRQYREMDFNTYIQQKRIQYIIQQIQSEPDLVEYKLAYLADLAGFPNQSKFSAVFKSVTGITPTVFIHYTKEELTKRKELV